MRIISTGTKIKIYGGDLSGNTAGSNHLVLDRLVLVC